MVIITAGPATSTYTPPTFGPNKSSTITLSGYQVTADIALASGVSMVSAEISISNLNLATINSLASLGQPLYSQNQNTVTVLAGDASAGMSQVFSGTISTAYASFASMPDPVFNITAFTGIGPSLTPVPPTSFSGAVNVATLMQQLAASAQYTFENNGVSAVLANPYLPGTTWDQIKAVATAADINFIAHNGVLAIWPKNGARGGGVTTISPNTGLYGYPEYTAYGINFRTLFNPGLQFGSLVTIQSSLQPACGKWQIYSISHSLESQVPDGDWFSDVQTQYPEGLTIGQ